MTDFDDAISRCPPRPTEALERYAALCVTTGAVAHDSLFEESHGSMEAPLLSGPGVGQTNDSHAHQDQRTPNGVPTTATTGSNSADSSPVQPNYTTAASQDAIMSNNAPSSVNHHPSPANATVALHPQNNHLTPQNSVPSSPSSSIENQFSFRTAPPTNYRPLQQGGGCVAST